MNWKEYDEIYRAPKHEVEAEATREEFLEELDKELSME